MRVPAAARPVKLLCHAEMGFGGEAGASRSTGGMPEWWGTAGQWGSFQLMLHHLEVTQ
jgi:hypothetical protein